MSVSECTGDEATMPKVYIGGLAPNCDRKTLLSLLAEKEVIGHQAVEIKRGGYAFVQFESLGTAVAAVEKLNGKRYS